MSHTTADSEAPATVPYLTTVSRVAGLKRRLMNLRGLKLRRARRELPELTDAWFEETIREVDEAAARVQSDRAGTWSRPNAA